MRGHPGVLSGRVGREEEGVCLHASIYFYSFTPPFPQPPVTLFPMGERGRREGDETGRDNASVRV